MSCLNQYLHSLYLKRLGSSSYEYFSLFFSFDNTAKRASEILYYSILLSALVQYPFSTYTLSKGINKVIQSKVNHGEYGHFTVDVFMR